MFICKQEMKICEFFLLPEYTEKIPTEYVAAFGISIA